LNPRELFDTFEEATAQALRDLAANPDDDVFFVYAIKNQGRTQYGVYSELQFLATSHQWLNDDDIVYSTDHGQERA